MARLVLLFRSTAVRLSALYILLFGLCAAVLVFYVTSMSGQLIGRQVQESLADEIKDFSEIYARAGVNGILKTIERRARQPGANLYVIAGPVGQVLAGNVQAVDPGVLDATGWVDHPFRYTRYADDDVKKPQHVAVGYVFVLDNGLRILIARDLGEPQRLRYLVRRALMLALAIMGAGAVLIWFGIGRNALKRIDRMSAASKKIMAGDLTQRLPESGSGDEFDRLSVSLNAMIGRIAKLNEGLRQVSDNIAHDLKTPLTRLRNKAADALANPEPEARQHALEGIIAESDQLIRTFNALLMISRVEAGSVAAEMSPVDLAEIVADSAELYEPVAEDLGLALETDIAEKLSLLGNRELIGQALTNLMDNAIKYAVEGEGERKICVRAVSDGGEIRLSVADHGPGIPADRRDDVVKRFVRLDESRTKPGTGLGLSLVEAVMLLHGGRLELSDTEPDAEAAKGLTVTMIFPAARS
ncbi:sensor histidine kinase [Rhizobium sp. NRK18]|uniref:sensor histidine kinase n=1 Tax=Rhizobium sp. NRK18 TaxID=2964667 RepID=UPI0021C320E7|nr:HAMP domain-containing sensor histidine kinase [Rhizobium sp. NRK18]MCQ2004866.1 HAMP domain-containing histidine kinase [Rhizobium sp. NRK18]